MNAHPFLFQQTVWLGKGEISFATTKETVSFFTRWQLVDKTDQGFIWLQEVELHALDQTNRNLITVDNISEKGFHIRIENALMGGKEGRGIITPQTIAWELRTDPETAGYEIYELQSNGNYLFRAEYSSKPYQTIIEGEIWQKNLL